MWEWLKSKGIIGGGSCFTGCKRKNKNRKVINIRDIIVVRDYQEQTVVQTPSAIQRALSTHKSISEPSPTLRTLNTLKTASISHESLSSEALDELPAIEDREIGSLRKGRTLKRRHTLPLLSELRLSIHSQKSFSSGFEDFPEFFTADKVQQGSSDSESFVSFNNPRVSSQEYHEQSQNLDISPGSVRTRKERAKSMGFITMKERPKLITIPRQEHRALERVFTDEVKVTESTSVSTTQLEELPVPSFNPSVCSKVGAASTIDLNKPLPSLPRPHKTLSTMKKRLSRIFRFESQESIESLIPTTNVTSARVSPSATERAKSAGIVGKKVEMWEGMTASPPGESAGTEQTVPHYYLKTPSPAGESNFEFNDWDTIEMDRDSIYGGNNWKVHDSVQTSSSPMMDDSEMTIIVRPECASESFENLRLLSRPASFQSFENQNLQVPTTPKNSLHPSKNRLVRSPGYENLQKEAYTPPSAPSTPTPHSRYRRARSVSWMGIDPPIRGDTNDPRSPGSGIQPIPAIIGDLEFQENSPQPKPASVDGTASSGDPSSTSSRHSRHYSFHMNYNDFMDESLNRYGRSGFGGRMMREFPASTSMQFIFNNRDSRIDPSTERMIEIWGDVSVSASGVILC